MRAHGTSLKIFTHLYTEMGEKIHAKKFSDLFGCKDFIDIPSWVGEKYEEMALLNLALVDEGHSPFYGEEKFLSDSIALTWNAGLAALYGAGVIPEIAKLYVHHKGEKIPFHLYEKPRLLLTESLLAEECAREIGFENVLYFPHHFTGKPKKKKPEERLRIGCVSRLEYSKNIEHVLEIMREFSSLYNFTFYLKGDFPKVGVYPSYYSHLATKLTLYEKEGWLLWDNSLTPYEEMANLYSSFDFCIQPTGAEGASNVVVELLGLGIPVILLEVSTNPYLFRGGVLFAEAKKEPVLTQLPFYEPDTKSLQNCIERLFNPKERELLGLAARKVAEERFHPSIAIKRFAVMLDKQLGKDELRKIYDADRALYRL